MAKMSSYVSGQGYQYYYVTDYIVSPRGSKDPIDVMLVQFLVKMYFIWTKDTGIDNERNAFWSAHARATAKGGSWCDGAYGERTRDGVLAFERATLAPYKDGIVRPLMNPLILDVMIDYSNSTKLEKLNWNYVRERDPLDQLADMKDNCPRLLHEVN